MTRLEELAGAIDVLLTDNKLPDGVPHGIDLANMARMRRSDLIVIYMTAYPELLEGLARQPGEVFRNRSISICSWRRYLRRHAEISSRDP